MPTNNVGLDAAITFSYDETELGTLPEKPLRLYRSDSDDSDSWIDVSGDVDTVANALMLDGLSRLTQFTAGAPANGAVDVADMPRLPTMFALHGNYPNPFNPSTTIRYELPQATNVRLEVFDVLGRRVATVVDTHQPAGVHEALFAAGDLGSGIYLCRMKTGNFTATRRMMLVK